MSSIEQLLYALPPGLKYEIMSAVSLKTFDKGDELVKIDSICQHLYFIEEGVLRTYCVNDESKEINIEFSLEGQFITSIDSFYNQCPSKVAIESLEKSQVLCISRTDLYHFFENYPEMNKLGRLLTEENFVRREKWHIIKFSMDAGERYQNLVENFPELVQRVPLQHLASYLGMSKEHLSRIRAGD